MNPLSAVARALVLLVLVSVQLVYWCLGWTALLLTLRGKAARQAHFARRLRILIRSLGATYIKIGQIMSTRPDLFPPHVIAELEMLQDNVGAFSNRHVERTLVAEFGKPSAELFASFDLTPVASASVAQVHRATMLDGHEVAVKIRRPKLQSIVRFDMAVMRFVAKLIALRPAWRLLSPVESVEQFGQAIETQVDFEVEARNNRRFRENFAEDPEIDFPELVPELCSKRVLTMSFVDGTKVLRVDTEQHDPTRLAKIGFRTLLRMVFEHGFVHADLHPGNIFVRDDGVVVMLDLGLTAELGDAERVNFASHFSSWAAGDGATMARIMVENSPSANVRDYPAYEREVEQFVARYSDQALGDVNISEVVFDMMDILRRHRVRINPVFTMCNIAIAVTEGIGKQLDPTLDLMAETLPFFVQLRAAGKL